MTRPSIPTRVVTVNVFDAFTPTRLALYETQRRQQEAEVARRDAQRQRLAISARRLAKVHHIRPDGGR